MSSYREYKEKALKDPEVKAEYDSLEAEYDIIQAMIDARINQHMTQKDLSLGVDIQKIRESRYEDLAKRYFSAEEEKMINSAGPQEKRQEKFFAVWTEKEACGKALGTGIGKALLGKNTAQVCRENSLMLRHVPAEEGYECACCVPGEWADDEILIREI